MPVPNEAAELRVKVAELTNDLWHMSSQRDAAVASTQTLVQVPPLAFQTSEKDQQAAALEAEKKAIWTAKKKAAVEEAERRDAALEAERQAAALTKALKDEQQAAERVERNRLIKIKTDAFTAKRASEAKAKEHAKSVKIPMRTTTNRAIVQSSTSASEISSPGRKVTRAEEHAIKQAAADRDLAEKMGGLMRQTEAKKEAAYKSDTEISSTLAPASTPAPASTNAVERLLTPPLGSRQSVVESMAESKVEVMQKKHGNLIPLADFLAEVDGPVPPPMTFERVSKPAAPPAPIGHINYGEGFVPFTKSGRLTSTPKEEEAPLPVAPLAPSFSELVASPVSSGRPIIIYLDDEGKVPEPENYEDKVKSIHQSIHSLLSRNSPDEIDLDLSDASGDDFDTPIFHVPQLPMSDKLKAIDNHATNDWEDSDDEGDAIEVAPLIKLAPTNSDRRARLLGPWEETEPEVDLDKLVLATFFVPEPATIFVTGLDMSVHYLPAFRNAPNKNLYGGPMDVFHAHERYLRQKKGDCDFFKHGLFYCPTSDVQDALRTVHIANLPLETTIGDLMRRVRGGLVVSAKVLDTMKLMGSNSALVIFSKGASAANYVEFAKQHAITFGVNHTAVVTLVGTPTYPASASTQAAMDRHRHTRCIQIAGCPKGYIDQKALVEDLASISIQVEIENPISRDKCDRYKWVTYLDEHRAGSIEEPVFESETLYLSFSSVEMAGKAYNYLTIDEGKYDLLGVSPRFVEDACAGELGELLRLPPMDFERHSGPTALQNLVESFKGDRTFKPKVGDKPVDSVMPEPQAESALTAAHVTAKRHPLLMTALAYQQLFS